MTARRLLLLSVVRPSLEYSSEIWDCLKSFMACVEDDIREREAEEFGKVLDGKVKLEGLVGRENL